MPGQMVPATDGRIRRGDELLGEECVPVRPARDRVEQGRRRWRADDARQQVHELAPLEPSQIEPVDLRLALGLGQPGRQRVPAMEFVRAERPDDAQSLVAHVPPQEREQVARRAVSPVEVLDDEEDRSVGRQAWPSRRRRPSKIRIWSQSAWLVVAFWPPSSAAAGRRQLGHEAGEDR